MNDALRPFALEKIRDTPPVGDIELDELKSAVRGKPCEARLASGNVVVVVEVIEPRTWSPRARSRSATCIPMNPAAPVTKTFK